MANTINQAKRKKEINKLSEAQLNKELSAVKNRVDEFEGTINTQEAKKNSLLKAGDKKRKELTSAHKNDISKLSQEKETLENEINKLEKKSKNASEKVSKQKKTIDNKKSALRKKHIEVLSDAIDEKSVNHKKTVEEYQNKLENLRNIKKEQTEKYNKRVEKLDENENKTKKKLADKKVALKERKEKLVVESNNAVEELEQKRNNIISDNQKAIDEFINAAQTKQVSLLESEEMSISEKRAQLNSLYNKLDELKVKRDSNEKDFELIKQQLDGEYVDLQERYDTERESLIQSNNSLKSHLQKRKEEIKNQRAIELEDYKNKVAELDEMVKLFGEKETITVSNFNNILKKNNAELKSKYTELVNHLDEQYLQEVKFQEKELEDLKYRLQKEQEQLKERNAYLFDRYSNRESEYKRINESMMKENNELQDVITVLDKDYTSRINDLKADIRSIKAKHYKELEDRKAELTVRVDSIKAEKKAIKDELTKERVTVSDEINKVNDEIVSLNNELNAYISKANSSKENLTNKYQYIEESLNKETIEINESIVKLEESVVAKEKQHQERLEKLAIKKQKAIDDHNQKISSLNIEHENKINELDAQQDKKIADINAEYDEKYVQLAARFEKDKEDIANEDIKKKEEFDTLKANIEKQTEDLEVSNAETVAQLKEQKEDLLNQIDGMKQNLQFENEKYLYDKKTLEAEREERLTSLEEEYRIKAEEASKYDPTPVDELEATKQAYANKIIEHDEVERSVSEQKANIDEQINSFVKENDERIKELEGKLVLCKEQYNNRKAEADAIYERLENELANENENVNAKQKELDEELNELKSANEIKLKDFVAKLEEEYQEQESILKEKQETTNSLYEKEIAAKQEELASKKTSYENVINEVKRRKAKIEYDCANIYNQESSKTNQVQDELNRVNQENEFKRAEWNKDLELRRQEIETELNNLRASHESIIIEKKKSLEEMLQGLRQRNSDLKVEINALEEENSRMRNDLESYRIDKKNEFDSIKIKTNDYLNDINIKLNDIANMENELNDMHTQRVLEIKKHIAKTMADYDQLNKAKPFALRKESEESMVVLEKVATEFREKTDSLNRAHEELLNRLADKKKETIAKLDEQISDLVADRTSIHKSYENDIKELTQSYELLIAEEKIKQRALVQEIEKDNQVSQKAYQVYGHDKEVANAMFKQQVAERKATTETKVTSLEDYYKTDIERANDDIRALLSKKNSIVKDMDSIRKRYNDIDNDITNRKNALMGVFRNKIQEIDEYYSKKVADHKNQYRELDMIKGGVSDIFKRK